MKNNFLTQEYKSMEKIQTSIMNMNFDKEIRLIKSLKTLKGVRQHVKQI